MPNYKKVIFVKAIEVRLLAGEGTVEAIIDSYEKLTDEEKAELLTAFA